MARQTKKLQETPVVIPPELEKKLQKTERKLDNARERIKIITDTNANLAQGVANLEKQLEDAKVSQDFLNLKTLYEEVKVLKSWERKESLPFGQVKFSITEYGCMQITLTGVPFEKKNFPLSASEWACLMMFCDDIHEAYQKKEQLEDLEKRIRPLQDMVTTVSQIVVEHTGEKIT